MSYESVYHLSKNHFKDPLNFRDVKVYQIGRYYCTPNTVIEAHVQLDLFELTVVTDGEGIIKTNGIPVKVQKGDIYLSLPHDTHEIISDRNKPLKFDFFAFNCDDAEIKADLELITENFYSSYARTFTNERIPKLLSTAIAELNGNKKYSMRVLESLFGEIVIYVIRGFSKLEPEKYPDSLTAAEVLCHRMANYIDTHLYSLKSLEDLSPLTDYSYGYLSSLFHKTTGESLADYYRRKKHDTARLLVLEGRLKLTEIAEMLNYSSAYAFSKAFSKRFGQSPREYRKNHSV